MRNLIFILIIFLSLPWQAAGDTGIKEGRFARTSKKALQSSLDHFPIVQKRQRNTGYSVEKGRRLFSSPTEDFSVGLIGCPGCSYLLQSINGIYFLHGAE